MTGNRGFFCVFSRILKNSLKKASAKKRLGAFSVRFFGLRPRGRFFCSFFPKTAKF